MKLLPWIQRFVGVKILVVGDLMVDRYICGEVSRLSPEAPVPVVDVRKENFMPGGAGNVASNIAALGGKPFLISVVGQDGPGDQLRQLLGERGVDMEGVVEDSSRPTILKTRVLAGHQQVVRFDQEDRRPLSRVVLQQVLEKVRARMPEVKGLVISDYGKGVVSSIFLKTVLSWARRAGKFVTVDPKIEHFLQYQDVQCITPNLKEAAEGMRVLPPQTDAEVDALGRGILKRLHCRTVLITRGERGMSLYEANLNEGGGKITHIPSQAREVFDVTGAGDTVISVFSLALAAGASSVEAARLSNGAASVVVGRLGTATVTPQELKAAL
jgi:D-beta-D-heptose 7-phosphate kinase/D-beta-D-heptose 1-phosphate adenosyltransferase